MKTRLKLKGDEQLDSILVRIGEKDNNEEENLSTQTQRPLFEDKQEPIENWKRNPPYTIRHNQV